MIPHLVISIFVIRENVHQECSGKDEDETKGRWSGGSRLWWVSAACVILILSSLIVLLFMLVTIKCIWVFFFFNVELEDQAHVLKEGNTLYNAVLGMVDIVRGTNSYYKLQILESDKSSRWGNCMSLNRFIIFTFRLLHFFFMDSLIELSTYISSYYFSFWLRMGLQYFIEVLWLTV